MFTARLINDPFSDPGLYVKFKYRNEAILFDLGDIHRLTAKEILKVKYIFISHTHMDHFIGFDHLVRVCLGRDRHITLFGPPGFIRNVESKMGGYTWNLVENYTNDFVLTVVEVHAKAKITRQYTCQEAFAPGTCTGEEAFDGTLVESPAFVVRAVCLDHRIPSLAFSLEERHHVNVKKNALLALGLSTGKWLAELKQSVMRGDPDDTPISVKAAKGGQAVESTLPLRVLKDSIIKITEGQKISYVADAIYSTENTHKIIALSRLSDRMFIEAPFLDEDRERATETYHLTAKQAGMLAREAGVRHVSLFHFSPKYKGSGDALAEEAMRAFRGEE